MKHAASLDFTRLLGFDCVAGQISNGIDFQDETVGAKLGAKVGEPLEPMRFTKVSSALDFTKLLGFDAVADQLSDGVNFKDEMVGAKLGAKVGEPS